MRKSDFVSNDETKRYGFLKEEAVRLFSELSKVTEKTSEQDVERLQAEYKNVVQERDEIGKRISLMQRKVVKKLQRMHTKPDGTDLKAFDEVAEDFFDALFDYYESCKIRLVRMLNELEKYPSKKLSIKQRFHRWKIKRRIRSEIDGYTRRQQECTYPYKS